MTRSVPLARLLDWELGEGARSAVGAGRRTLGCGGRRTPRRESSFAPADGAGDAECAGEQSGQLGVGVVGRDRREDDGGRLFALCVDVLPKKVGATSEVTGLGRRWHSVGGVRGAIEEHWRVPR